MSELKLFLPIAKVDADQRLVHGIATAEVADRAGEICDYESTKPYYEAWSQAMNEASGGKSLGAIRAMHGRVAAGKITDIAFDDAGKRIMIAAKIVDDDEWRKVQEGVYTGFSQGGRYVRRWSDSGGELTRYTAEPNEISLVDLPCVASATFEMIKDGVTHKRPFASRAAAPAEAPEAPEAPPAKEDAADASQRLDALAQLIALARTLSQQLIAETDALSARLGEAPSGEDLPASKIAAPPPPLVAAAEAAASPALAKALVETAALRTRLDDLTPDLAALTARIAALEAQPLPAKAALRAIAKSADGAAVEAAPVDEAIRRLAALPPQERAHALTKLSLANPMPLRF
jgi:hypothetical protein